MYFEQKESAACKLPISEKNINLFTGKLLMSIYTVAPSGNIFVPTDELLLMPRQHSCRAMYMIL